LRLAKAAIALARISQFTPPFIAMPPKKLANRWPKKDDELSRTAFVANNEISSTPHLISSEYRYKFGGGAAGLI
jgi:hypothetical protein